MNLTLNFYPFRITIIKKSPLFLTHQEVKLASCLQKLSTLINSDHPRSQTHFLFTILSRLNSQEVKATSCYNSLKTQLPRSQTHFLLQFSQNSIPKEPNSLLVTQSRNYYNTIINLEQINKS